MARDRASPFVSIKGWIYATGQRAEAEAIAAQFSRLPLRRVEIYGLLRDAEKTLEALTDQADLNPLRAAVHVSYPEVRFLRNDPRLAEFKRTTLRLP